jgi:hypothetical protein
MIRKEKAICRNKIKEKTERSERKNTPRPKDSILRSKDEKEK